MAEDRIIVDVDDTEIDIAIAKLKQAITLAATTGTRDLDVATRDLSDFASFWVMTERELLATGAETGFSVHDLPAINREMRIIIGQIPGMREAMRVYFMARRVMRGIEVGDVQLTLSLIATAVLLIKWNDTRIRNLERARLRREAWIRRERGLTHDQYLELMEEWQVEFRRIPG
jgi:hypothetical protein